MVCWVWFWAWCLVGSLVVCSLLFWLVDWSVGRLFLVGLVCCVYFGYCGDLVRGIAIAICGWVVVEFGFFVVSVPSGMVLIVCFGCCRCDIVFRFWFYCCAFVGFGFVAGCCV